MQNLDLRKAQKVVIPITDWRDDVVANELVITSHADVYKMLDEGVSSSDIGKASIVSRELGAVSDDILRPNKQLLLSGARADVAARYAKRAREVHAANGRVFRAPVYVGRLGRGHIKPEHDAKEFAVEAAVEDDTEVSYINAETNPAEASDRALAYLLEAVPGHIWNALLQIHAGGGDAKAAWKELKALGDDMVRRITDPQMPLVEE